MQTLDSYIADGISSLSIHNGIVRIVFMKLDHMGKPNPSIEICIPSAALKSVSDALNKVPR